VLVSRQVPPVQVYKEEREAANQHTGGAEVVTCLTTTTHIDVTCNKEKSLNSEHQRKYNNSLLL
jgi:hypothetical protein